MSNLMDDSREIWVSFAPVFYEVWSRKGQVSILKLDTAIGWLITLELSIFKESIIVQPEHIQEFRPVLQRMLTSLLTKFCSLKNRNCYAGEVNLLKNTGGDQK